MKHVVIVHGFKGKPETNWKPWLKQELLREGFAVDIPEMPDTNQPDAIAWNTKLTETIGTPSKETFLVGHSLGCITILRYLETLQHNEQIGACIFVAGFSEKFKNYAGGRDNFFDHSLDWSKIQHHCNRFVAIHSDDDPLVEIDQMNTFGLELGAKTIQLHGMGHFGSADDVYELPTIRDELLRIANEQNL